MNKGEFRSVVSPSIEEMRIGTEAVAMLLGRSAGFLEAVEGLKTNPEIKQRLNIKEITLLQVLVRVVFSLQCNLLDKQEEIEKYKQFQNENQELHRLLGDALEAQNRLKEELEKKT